VPDWANLTDSSDRSTASSTKPVKVGPGMNANGEVIDASEVESGSGQKVKGINDFEGERTGVPAPNSKLSQLQIGMGFRQVMDIAGQPRLSIADSGTSSGERARRSQKKIPTRMRAFELRFARRDVLLRAWY
jgi:hypothetical protein